MPNLKEVRIRITSVNSTKQITSAMKMVSAAKLKRAQNAIVQMRPYANKLKEILENLSGSLDSSEGIYSAQREVKNILIVAFTSNRGLCGAFNANVIKESRNLAFQHKNATVTVICAGKKAYDYFRKTDWNIKGAHLPRNFNHLYDKISYEQTAVEVEKIMKAFAEKQFDQVFLVYNAFKNAAVQVLTKEQFLPVKRSSSSPKGAGGNTIAGAKAITSPSGRLGGADYIFEPAKEELVLELIPKSLKTQFYKALLDSHASEHGARMTAMHKATDNASELLKDLRLTYNKARQAAITKEILEIVGGAEALKG